MTLIEFLSSFPELADNDAGKIETLIQQVSIETNSYIGLDSTLKQDHALGLHVAHYIDIDNQVTKFKNIAGGLNVVKVKSNNDEIQFGTTSGDRFDLANSTYGQRLKSFLDSQYLGGYGICLM